MTLFDDILYWNEGGTIKVTNKSIELGDVIDVYEVPDSLASYVSYVTVELVHARKQPGGESVWL